MSEEQEDFPIHVITNDHEEPVEAITLGDDQTTTSLKDAITELADALIGKPPGSLVEAYERARDIMIKYWPKG